MLQICRAEDGQVFQVNATLWDIERLGSLELFLEQETAVDQDAVLAYLSDGRRLRSENIRELAGAQDQTIYVYNKRYLDLDLNLVLQQLRIEAPLEPSVEDTIAATPPFRPSQLATSYLRTAHVHQEHVNTLVMNLRYQHEALRIASNTLDLNVLAIADAFEGIASGAEKELDKQKTLLAGVDADLEIISRVKIHAEFMSPAVRKAMEAGEKARTLGDYVSNVKMRQVAETCARTHGDLRARFLEVQDAVSRLNQGTDDTRAIVANAGLVTDAEGCMRRSRDIFDKITDAAASIESPTADADKYLQGYLLKLSSCDATNLIEKELRQLDLSFRNELAQTTNIKNAYTEQCISVLRRISTMNDDLVQLPSALTSLQASFRAKTSFSHIQRLHNMLYAYGATVLEIVRRKEFARFFYQRAQSILEVMAKLSSAERKRRQVYRGEMHGQLPFETRGMDDSVPTIDFSPTGSLDSPYSLERADVDDLVSVLDDLEHFAQSSSDSAAINSVHEARNGLGRLIGKMDGIESGFDRIAERSLLSASWLSTHRRRSTEDAYEELAEQFRALQQSNLDQQSLFQADRSALEAEITHLNGNVRGLEAASKEDQERLDSLERELHSARAQIEGDATCRQILETRNAEMLADVKTQRQAHAHALADATEQTKIAGLLKQELAQVKAEFQDVKTLEERHAQRIAVLLQEQASTIRNLEESRSKGQDMESQVQAVCSESEEMKRALLEASREKDRLLRLQASEHDRIIRDHIAEADGDRAVLEHQFSELRAAADDAEMQLKDARSQVDMAHADAQGLREELQRLEHELREAHHVEQVLRGDLRDGRASQSDYEQRLEDSGRLIAQLLDVAIAFRNSHVKAMTSAQALVSHPISSKLSPNPAADPVFSPAMRHSIIGQHDEPSPIDPSDPTTALEVLRTFDHDHFLETINKTGSTIRKWQKQCKEYRERAKGKISFRNFAKGDLALFLPTRNSVSKPWAAFNVSFPHYFLSATGHLAEQLKTREWIVARITLITERVVDHRDPDSNPYGLGDGVKYYMLEVEDWTQQNNTNHPAKRRVSSRKVSSTMSDSSPMWENVLPVPAEADKEESFNEARPRNLPARSRANSTPVAGPSSLSRLLAQAGPESTSEPIPGPAHKPPSPITISPNSATQRQPVSTPTNPSPLRPGSRASRISTTSRLSIGRLPGTVSTAKATATTAVTEQPISGTQSMDNSPSKSTTESSTAAPSPEGSPSDGMFSILSQQRRRTVSYSVSRTSPLANATTISTASTMNAQGVYGATNSSAGSRLANLATNWGVPFGRRKRTEGIQSLESIAQAASRSDDTEDSMSASQLLKKL